MTEQSVTCNNDHTQNINPPDIDKYLADYDPAGRLNKWFNLQD
jgi:hypothetical protein